MLHKQQILKRLCEELRQRPILQFACKKAGISRSQCYRWMQEDPAFAKTVAEAQREGTEVVNDFSVSKLLTGISNDNLGAVFFWLRHRHPDFSNKLEITAKHELTHVLTDEEKKVIADALKLSGLSDQERDGLNTLLTDHGHAES